MQYKSFGFIKCFVLNNGACKMNVMVDRGLSNFYLSLIPKYYYVQRQKYPPHITVVRNEFIENKYIKLFWSFNKKRIVYKYNNEVKNNYMYWWLEAYCNELYNIRKELSLPRYYAKKPIDGVECFHITIGNTKHLIK